ncbi:MAG TPA: arsenic resistance N-acetyltransferase ArsN2 [Steroidobacteraceae bacterium]|jgi:amino-acid N-acetyltransferase
MNRFEIHPTPPLDSATALLGAVGLPASDLTERHLDDFLYCGPAESLQGLVGLEIYGHDALLRSLAVSPQSRRTGMGAALVQHAERHALGKGVRTVYLLTTGARTFFEELGYGHTTRESCPLAIRSTQEFASLCPETSAILMKRLRWWGL